MSQPDPHASRAVLIGVANYEHMEELPAVARNLIALQQELVKPEVWGLPPQNCTVVGDPPDQAEMIKPVIEAAQDARDVLLVYFAGHGLPDDQGNLVLGLPKTPNDRGLDFFTTVPYDHLRRAVQQSRAQYNVVILDCCFSGNAAYTMSSGDMASQTHIEGSYLIASAPANKKALAPPEADFTAFTEELIKVMRNGIPGADRLLTLDALFEHLKSELIARPLPQPWRQNRNDAGRLTLLKNRAHASFQRPPGYGEIPGVLEGRQFFSRKDLHLARVHRPLQAGICGTQQDGGAESIVVSGGYVDDEDHDEVIIYTGHGGRDSATGRQVADQRATDSGNAALLASITTRYPVRVIRGASGDPRYSPPEGFSYDGLYTVESHWFKTGVDGFRIIQFRLEKMHDNAPPIVPSDLPADRAGVNIARWGPVGFATYQDRRVADKVRQAHNHECQICGTVMQTPAGFFVTPTVHLQPLTIPHKGPDIPANLLCVCPTHREQLSYGTIIITDDLLVIDQPNRVPVGYLEVNSKHQVGREYLRYHRELHQSAEGAL